MTTIQPEYLVALYFLLNASVRFAKPLTSQPAICFVLDVALVVLGNRSPGLVSILLVRKQDGYVGSENGTLNQNLSEQSARMTRDHATIDPACMELSHGLCACWR